MLPSLPAARSEHDKYVSLSIFIPHCHGGSKHVNQTRKRNLKTEKEEVKLPYLQMT